MPHIAGFSSLAITELLQSITTAPRSLFQMVDPKLLHAVGKKLIAYSGVEETSTSLDERVDDFITKNKLAIISKTTCPYCRQVKGLLNDISPIKPEVWEINEEEEMSEIQDMMKTITGGRSVPRVFAGGEFIGGCDDTFHLFETGKLMPLLRRLAEEEKQAKL